VFVIRVLKRLFISVREEVKEGWKKLSDQEFIIRICSPPNIVRMIGLKGGDR
jgi:hypothetical protein